MELGKVAIIIIRNGEERKFVLFIMLLLFDKRDFGIEFEADTAIFPIKELNVAS
jgi:hypothetical protein